MPPCVKVILGFLESGFLSEDITYGASACQQAGSEHKLLPELSPALIGYIRRPKNAIRAGYNSPKQLTFTNVP